MNNRIPMLDQCMFSFNAGNRARGIFVVAVVFLQLLVACGSVETAPTIEPTIEVPSDTPTSSEIVTLGVISGEPSKVIRERQNFVDYLAVNLADFGIIVGEVRVTPSMDLMAQWMETGEVDMMMDSFYPAAIVRDISGATPILFRQRNKDDKRAVFFTRVDTGITRFEDLPGNIIVLEEPDSTSGYLLPIFYLLESGMKVVAVPGPDAIVAPDEVGYVFSGDDDAVVQWVLSGMVPVGAAQDNVYEDFGEENAELLVALLETEPIIRDQTVLVGPLVDVGMKDAIRDLMQNLGETEEGLALLEELETARFTTLSPERQSDFDRAQQMYNIVNSR